MINTDPLTRSIEDDYREASKIHLDRLSKNVDVEGSRMITKLEKLKLRILKIIKLIKEIFGII